MAAGDNYIPIQPSDRWILDANNNIVGVQNNRANGADLRPAQLTDLAASSGASLVGFMPSGAGAVATTEEKKLRERISVFDFLTAAQIADVQSGAPALDLAAPLANAAAFLAANATRYKLVFPSGIYLYSASPAWAIANAVIEAEGEVRLRYTGTGNAVNLDATAAGVYNMKMGYFIVEAPATALSGVYVAVVHHSRLGFNVRGCGANYPGIDIHFGVCTVFEKPTVSVNENGWYQGAKPAIGIRLTGGYGNEPVSYCTFENPIVEGPPTGVQHSVSLGNTFIGGTVEGCATYGVFAPSGASNDKYIGTDFESNPGSDAYVMGTDIIFDGCDSTNQIAFGSTAKRGGVIGGEHKSILFDTGSSGCKAIAPVYNRANNGGTFTDAGTASLIVSPRNAATNASYLTATGAFGAVAGMPNATNTSVAIAVPGAVVGERVLVGVATQTAGYIYTGQVSTAGFVTVLAVNVSGASANLTATNVTVQVLRL